MAVKCHLISIGETNRYIFLIFIGAIFFGGSSSIKEQSKNFDENLHPIILTIINSLSLSLSFILLIIYEIYNKSQKEKKLGLFFSIKKQDIEIKNKEKFLWILFVSIIDFIANILDFIFWVGEIGCFSTDTFDILFLTILSYFILKERLYKHHYLSVIVFMILSLLYNLINKYYGYDFLKSYYLNIIFIYLSRILFEFKYVLYVFYMIKKYMVSFEIMFYQGIIELVLSIIMIIITTNIGYLDNFWNYYNNLDAKEIIIFISLIICQLIYNLSYFIVIEKFSPFYVLLLDILSELIFYFFDFNIDDLIVSIFSIIFIAICLIMILIFVEIIEFNFFGLSFMTKKNIEIRAKIDSTLVMEIKEDVNDIKIDYQNYSVNLDEDKSIEMIDIDS